MRSCSWPASALDGTTATTVRDGVRAIRSRPPSRHAARRAVPAVGAGRLCRGVRGDGDLQHLVRGRRRRSPLRDFAVGRARARADELWKTTCFERSSAKTARRPIASINFAPSGEWAAYDFDRPPRRHGERRSPRPALTSGIEAQSASGGVSDATFVARRWPEVGRLGLTAVIEERTAPKAIGRSRITRRPARLPRSRLLHRSRSA